MRPQKVSVDSWYMLTVSAGCIGLIIAVRVLLRLIQAIFWLPGYIEKMELQMAEEKAKLNLPCEKELSQDPELEKEKSDVEETGEESGKSDDKTEEFEELTNDEQKEDPDYAKNKDD